jgi:hypothetical protein
MTERLQAVFQGAAVRVAIEWEADNLPLVAARLLGGHDV